MSGMPYPKTATLAEGENTLNGCGGNSLDLLAGGEWVVEDIGNGGVIDNSRVTMVFEPTGRVSGRASCNTYSGGFSLTGEGIAFGPLATTRMACAPALMNQEAKFLAMLGVVERFEIDETGALVFYGGGERRLLARR
jgi:heat shock protein HslJ